MGHARHRRSGGAAAIRAGLPTLALLAALALSACGSSASGSAAPTGSRAPLAGASGASAGLVGSARPGLAASLAALNAGYTYDTTVTVAGKVAAHVKGRHLGDASELVVDSGGASITYRMIPPDSWVLQPGGDWVLTEGAVPGGDPLAPLLSPITSQTVSTTSIGTTLKLSYPASALGLTGSSPVEVTMVIGNGGAVTVSYAAAITGGQAVSSTTFTPQPTQEPIVAPTVGPEPAG